MFSTDGTLIYTSAAPQCGTPKLINRKTEETHTHTHTHTHTRTHPVSISPANTRLPRWPSRTFLFVCLFLHYSCAKSHLVRTQSVDVVPLKPGVGQYIAIPAMLTARDFFLAYFYPCSLFICIFSKTSPEFSCVGCGEHLVPV